MVLRIFSEVIDIQDMIHEGVEVNTIQARIEKMGETIGGFSEESCKKMLEALGAEDLEKKCGALIEAIWLDIYKKISYLVSEEPS